MSIFVRIVLVAILLVGLTYGISYATRYIMPRPTTVIQSAEAEAAASVVPAAGSDVDVVVPAGSDVDVGSDVAVGSDVDVVVPAGSDMDEVVPTASDVVVPKDLPE
jgi:hypothetical protein